MLPLVIISDIAYLFCGVRQGSILGPLLFLIYVNDIKYCADNCDSRSFADGINVFVSDKSVCDVIGQANSILSSLSAWFTSNKLSVSIDKTCYSLFNCDRKDGCSCPLVTNGITVNEVITTKYLGIMIDNSLTWSEHIN